MLYWSFPVRFCLFPVGVYCVEIYNSSKQTKSNDCTINRTEDICIGKMRLYAHTQIPHRRKTGQTHRGKDEQNTTPKTFFIRSNIKHCVKCIKIYILSNGKITNRVFC